MTSFSFWSLCRSPRPIKTNYDVGRIEFCKRCHTWWVGQLPSPRKLFLSTPRLYWKYLQVPLPRLKKHFMQPTVLQLPHMFTPREHTLLLRVNRHCENRLQYKPTPVFRQWRRRWHDFIVMIELQRLLQERQLMKICTCIFIDIQKVLEHTLGISTNTSRWSSQ